MGKMLLMIAIAMPLGLSAASAYAHGCVKGAAVGAVAGHVAGHHAVAGAAVGCVVGHHRAKVKEREAAKPQSPPPQNGSTPSAGAGPVR